MSGSFEGTIYDMAYHILGFDGRHSSTTTSHTRIVVSIFCILFVMVATEVAPMFSVGTNEMEVNAHAGYHGSQQSNAKQCNCMCVYIFLDSACFGRVRITVLYLGACV